MATLFYFPNDLFRQKGLRVSSLEMDQLGQRLGVKIHLVPDKAGGTGFMSKYVLKNMGVDVLYVIIEGEETAVRAAIRAIYEKYGPYETQRGDEFRLSKEMLKELART